MDSRAGLSFDTTTDRYIRNSEDLPDLLQTVRLSGRRVVLTSGTWDLVHGGHALYLEEARRSGDFLVVGVDSDEKTRTRKGPDRPIVPQEERAQMLTHFRHVDVVVIKELSSEKWELIKLVEPDVLIATVETYTPEDLEELSEFCREVIVLPRMATTTTSARLRLMQIDGASKLAARVAPRLPGLFREVLDEMKGGEG